MNRWMESVCQTRLDREIPHQAIGQSLDIEVDKEDSPFSDWMIAGQRGFCPARSATLIKETEWTSINLQSL